MQSNVTTASRAAAAVLLCAGAATPLNAAVVSWTNGAGGMWSDDANWSSPKIPEKTDDLQFFLANTYAVTLDKDYENRTFKVRHGHVTFDLGGYTHTANLPLGSFPTVDFVVGDVAGNASATFLNGTVNHDVLWIGGVPGGAGLAGVSASLTFGAGSTLNAHHIMLWGTDLGRLEFRDGAQANFVSGINTPSFGAAATNEALITGAGTVVSGSSFNFSQNGVSHVTVSDGAVLTSSSSIYFTKGGSLTIDNATVTTSRLADFNATEDEFSVSVVNGGKLNTTSSFTQLGQASAHIDISGVGSRWVASDPMSVGYQGTAIVNVTDGGEAWFPSIASFGRQAGSYGEINVSGVVASPDNGAPVRSRAILWGTIIGDEGEGVVRILDGAEADYRDNMTLGRFATGNGHVLVSGAGSTWIDQFGNDWTITVGREGHGVFEAADQGYVRLAFDSMILGEMSGSRGELIARDAGTLVDIGNDFAPFLDSGLVAVGRGGEGLATVSDGAHVVSDRLVIGELAGSDGLVDVRSDGSRWTVRHSGIIVGGAGMGVLNIDRGGLVEVLNGAVTVGADGRITGNGVLITPSVVNDGAITPGGGEDPLEINGDYEQTKNGTFEYTLGVAEKTPRGDVFFDGLLVTGDATLAGTLRIVPADGFTPEPGVFDLIRASSIIGEFDTELFPKARGALSYSVEYTETAVRLIVVPAPGAAALAMGALLGVGPRRGRRCD